MLKREHENRSDTTTQNVLPWWRVLPEEVQEKTTERPAVVATESAPSTRSIAHSVTEIPQEGGATVESIDIGEELELEARRRMTSQESSITIAANRTGMLRRERRELFGWSLLSDILMVFFGAPFIFGAPFYWDIWDLFHYHSPLDSLNGFFMMMYFFLPAVYSYQVITKIINHQRTVRRIAQLTRPLIDLTPEGISVHSCFFDIDCLRWEDIADIEADKKGIVIRLTKNVPEIPSLKTKLSVREVHIPSDEMTVAPDVLYNRIAVYESSLHDRRKAK